MTKKPTPFRVNPLKLPLTRETETKKDLAEQVCKIPILNDKNVWFFTIFAKVLSFFCVSVSLVIGILRGWRKKLNKTF